MVFFQPLLLHAMDICSRLMILSSIVVVVLLQLHNHINTSPIEHDLSSLSFSSPLGMCYSNEIPQKAIINCKLSNWIHTVS